MPAATATGGARDLEAASFAGSLRPRWRLVKAVDSHGGWSAYNSLTTAICLNKVQETVPTEDLAKVPQMKNVYEVLRQKELELARLEKEVEALRVAAPLLSDDKDAAIEATNNKPTL